MNNIIEVIKSLMVVMFQVKDLKPNPKNPRIDLDCSHIDCSDGITEPLLIKADGTILRGHLRHLAAKAAGLKEVPVRIIEQDIDLATELELLNDHNSSKALGKAEAFHACRNFFELGYSEMDVLRKCFNILNATFGKPKDGMDFENLKSKHRGTLQNFARLSRLPIEVQDEYLKKYTDGNSRLTQKDIKNLVKVLESDGEEAVMEAYQAILEVAKTGDEKETESAPKMQSKKSIEGLLAVAKNPVVQRTLKWVLGQEPDAKFREFAIKK